MITGFNTDIEYEGVTYHVQTEDKGLETPIILSLVYHKGTILASKRSPYNDLIETEFDKKILAERLQKQHNLICAVIRKGRIEDLKSIFAEDSAEEGKGSAIKKESEKTARPADEFILELEDDARETEDVEVVWDIPMDKGLTAIEDDEYYEEEVILPGRAGEIVSDLSMHEEFANDALKIKFLKDYKFRSGEKKNIGILICRGDEDNSVAGANVMIKIIGSEFRPTIFHTKTNGTGIANVELKFPKFRGGSAAVLVRANANGEETELRRVITRE